MIFQSSYFSWIFATHAWRPTSSCRLFASKSSPLISYHPPLLFLYFSKRDSSCKLLSSNVLTNQDGFESLHWGASRKLTRGPCLTDLIPHSAETKTNLDKMSSQNVTIFFVLWCYLFVFIFNMSQVEELPRSICKCHKQSMTAEWASGKTGKNQKEFLWAGFRLWFWFFPPWFWF